MASNIVGGGSTDAHGNALPGSDLVLLSRVNHVGFTYFVFMFQLCCVVPVIVKKSTVSRTSSRAKKPSPMTRRAPSSTLVMPPVTAK